MLNLFSRYACIGVANTLIHWAVFAATYYVVAEQSISNLVGFCAAVSFSFFANAKLTFRQQATPGRYVAYVVFLGSLSYAVGSIADASELPPLVTLVVFSALSLVIGFLYSRYVVFRSGPQ
nr:GtrA family protein [Pseudomonas sp.]